MKKVVLFSLLFLASLAISQAQFKEKGDALIPPLKSALNQHDAPAFAQCFTQDADFMNAYATTHS